MILENTNNKTDNELVELTKKDPAVFGVLMERYDGKLLTYIRRISSVPNEEAEDILQDSFLKAYQNLNNFDNNLSFSSWMYRIVHNETVSHWRKDKSRPQGNIAHVDDEFLERIVDTQDIVGDVDKEILKKTLEDIMVGMDDKYREILILKYIEDKSYDEISDILKKPPGTIATHISRAKKQFRELCVQKDINFLL
ncbi:MAG: RNA polymerase sigma factor [Patescibacteria group bacterium]|nr:RNA polymerase sigma factor [Patescibacteria group bacterium]